MFKLKFLLTLCLSFPFTLIADDKCWDNKILSVKAVERFPLGIPSHIKVDFETPVHGQTNHIFINVNCSRFYDEIICDYQNELLPGWEISRHELNDETWVINQCVEE